MGLSEYIGILRKRWLSITATAAVGVCAALLVTMLTTSVYQATSQVYVSVRGGASVNELAQGSAYTGRQVESYAALATSPRVLEPVIEELGLDSTPYELASSVSAEQPAKTVLIDITVRDESPDLVARIANGVAESLATVVQELEQATGSEEDSPVQISTVREAAIPTDPVAPRAGLNLALGIALGLLLGVGLAVLRDLLDTRIRSAAHVAAVTDASVIGAIAYEEDAADHPLIIQGSPHSPRAEAFRSLRTNLQFLEAGGGPRTFVISSALPGEGKSTTSVNLAITLADAGSRVLVVDADLRRPSVSNYLGLEGAVGLTTVLIGRASLDDAIQPWGHRNLHVLASGQIPPNPSELLGSAAMTSLMDELGERYDVVIVDTAPLLPVTDGAVLAKLIGGAVIVIGAGLTHRQQLAGALDSLAKVGAKVHGIVINRLALEEQGGYHYGDYGYAPLHEAGNRPEDELPVEDGAPRHVRPHRWFAGGEARPVSAEVPAGLPEAQPFVLVDRESVGPRDVRADLKDDG
ncbi:polysaccharide biosynthesis tyrosine autokinase [Promicromonospora thailandica]|uniref:non-specific protein-tyrosine kinase n=1 Tax=Promicromonospora thailandica TaxID=765201 RepID=A0A9X2G2X4_9MICO|nr:polysaccharide biosynthesis tyrosine autokinase [Promicromonospora thailandica]MCP2264683.1 capsular exopolysaccharide family [Promicromonospora thailandica]BFF20238.1 polysaccharide biosynthesis tyrosine autokinase [Promicromonospora thailandica]